MPWAQVEKKELRSKLQDAMLTQRVVKIKIGYEEFVSFLKMWTRRTYLGESVLEWRREPAIAFS